jgi:hypothetical protein
MCNRFIFSFTIYFIKTSNTSHFYLNLWLTERIFQHNFLLNFWSCDTEMARAFMPPRYPSAGLSRNRHRCHYHFRKKKRSWLRQKHMHEGWPMSMLPQITKLRLFLFLWLFQPIHGTGLLFSSVITLHRQ